MSTTPDPVAEVQMALRKLARDPRALALKIANPLALLERALEELTERQSAIALAVLQIDAGVAHVLSSHTREKLRRCLYGADVPRVHSDD